ncbi:MAG TPA: cation-transporting P-type ATPase, partial [Candidatus Nanoarchaeia archaeon]|nr:cation-transporting P-type ATPase [Candidatus Nanoarchaeia archaeon]
TLGSTTVICTDKTGTLTANEMTVKKIFAGNDIIDVSGTGYSTEGNFHIKNRKIDPSKIKNLLLAGILNNNSELKDGKIIGDPTEGCLIVSGAKAGLVKESLEVQYKRIHEIEFTSERKLMTTVHKNKKETISYVKGAPEVLVKLCSQIEINGKTRKLTKQDIKKILDANHEFADSALRVLGFAYKKKPGKNPEKNLVFAGLQGMIDPPRQDVRESIEKCEKAGIRVIMITGDHEITAKAVAKSIGLHGNAVTGAYIDEHPDLEHIVEHVSIFARVNPEHKIKIVDALKKKGHIVAMTGDGVNDAPALKKADIGIAMGISGTDVSKEASSMILIDDKFSSIVNAVEEGRGTYDNIRKYFAYLISGNIGEVLIIFFGIIFGLPLPLTATQILLINLVTDGLPALALSADPFEPNAMSRKPRKQGQPIYKGLSAFIIYYPILLTITSLSVFCYFYFYKESLLMAQTATFLTISISELYQAFACRSTIYPAHKVGLFKNKYLILAVVSSFLLMGIAVYIEPVGKVLGMTSIGIFEFIAIVVISSFGTLVIEMSKHFRSRPRIS